MNSINFSGYFQINDILAGFAFKIKYKAASSLEDCEITKPSNSIWLTPISERNLVCFHFLLIMQYHFPLNFCTNYDLVLSFAVRTTFCIINKFIIQFNSAFLLC
jgi:hypothetical protein